MKYFYVVCDYNDGDFSKGIVSITEEEKAIIDRLDNLWKDYQ